MLLNFLNLPLSLRRFCSVLLFCRVQCNQEDTLTILYSSGTTGPSKGVVLTHGNFIAAVTMLDSVLNPQELRVILAVIPMFHIFGLQVCLTGVRRGDKVVLLPRFDFLEMLGAIEKHRVTFVPLVPPILIAMIKQDVVLNYDMSSLRKIGSAGAPLGADQLNQFAQRFPNAQLAQVTISGSVSLSFFQRRLFFQQSCYYKLSEFPLSEFEFFLIAFSLVSTFPV